MALVHRTKNRDALLGALFLLLMLAGSIWYMFLRVTNEIGPVGADKVGRQVMIQTLEAAYGQLHPGTKVSSEWGDYNLLLRLLQEPMRTTLRIVAPSDQPPPDSEQPRRFLDSPYSGLLVVYCGGHIRNLLAGACSKITIREDMRDTIPEVQERLLQLGAQTTEDLLAAWGFRRFEVFHGPELVARFDLKVLGRPNVKHIGGD